MLLKFVKFSQKNISPSNDFIHIYIVTNFILLSKPISMLLYQSLTELLYWFDQILFFCYYYTWISTSLTIWATSKSLLKMFISKFSSSWSGSGNSKFGRTAYSSKANFWPELFRHIAKQRSAFSAQSKDLLRSSSGKFYPKFIFESYTGELHF